MKFGLRALMAAVVLIAIAAALIPTDAVPVASIPTTLWVAGVAWGIFLARGRELRCIVYATVGGFLGAAGAVGSIALSDQMSLSTWFSPLVLILLGGMGGALIGCVVRAIMEGVSMNMNRQAPKNP